MGEQRASAGIDVPLHGPCTWRDRMSQGSDASLGVMTEHLKASDAPHRVIIDCTPSAVVPRFYPKWMEQVCVVLEEAFYGRWTLVYSSAKAR